MGRAVLLRAYSEQPRVRGDGRDPAIHTGQNRGTARVRGDDCQLGKAHFHLAGTAPRVRGRLGT